VAPAPRKTTRNEHVQARDRTSAFAISPRTLLALAMRRLRSRDDCGRAMIDYNGRGSLWLARTRAIDGTSFSDPVGTEMTKS
jgi:hypothetical protein